MGKIKVTCKACGKELEREEKPAPKNAREAKQIYFFCTCGARNLRDGTTAEFSKENLNNNQGKEKNSPDGEPRKEAKQKKYLPRRTKESEEQNHEEKTVQKDDDSGPFFL